jgi:hypothetical protein
VAVASGIHTAQHGHPDALVLRGGWAKRWLDIFVVGCVYKVVEGNSALIPVPIKGSRP